MARARKVHVEVWELAQEVGVSQSALSLYFGLSTYAGRDGEYFWHPRLIRDRLYPGRTDIREVTIKKQLAELCEKGFLRRETRNGKDFAVLNHFVGVQYVFKNEKNVRGYVPENTQITTEKVATSSPQSRTLTLDSQPLTLNSQPSTAVGAAAAFEAVEIQFENLKPEEKAQWELAEKKLGKIGYRQLSAMAKSLYLKDIVSITSDNVYNEINDLTHFSEAVGSHHLIVSVNHFIHFSHTSKFYSSVKSKETKGDLITALSRWSAFKAFGAGGVGVTAFRSAFRACVAISGYLTGLSEDKAGAEFEKLESLLERFTLEQIALAREEVATWRGERGVSFPLAYLAAGSMASVIEKISKPAAASLVAEVRAAYDAEKAALTDALSEYGFRFSTEFERRLTDDEKNEIAMRAAAELPPLFSSAIHDVTKKQIVAGFWAVTTGKTLNGKKELAAV